MWPHPSPISKIATIIVPFFCRRFEGEFQAGYAHGLGMFTSEMRGEVYIGEFFAGQKHG